MPDVDVSAAAHQLDLRPRRVRALLERGEIKGRKIGAHWLVESASVEQRLKQRPGNGRPFSPRIAWAYLLMLSGEAVPWLDPASRSRLRTRVYRDPVAAVLPKLRKRAHVHRYAAPANVVARIRALPDIVLSGGSAAYAYSASLN